MKNKTQLNEFEKNKNYRRESLPLWTSLRSNNTKIISNDINEKLADTTMKSGLWQRKSTNFFSPKLKNYTVDTTQVFNAHYKGAENIYTHGRVATEIYEQLFTIKSGELSANEALLSKLPPLTVSQDWTPRWYLDLPLQCVTLNSEQLQVTLPLRYLLSDIFLWSASRSILYCKTKIISSFVLKKYCEGLMPGSTSGPPPLQILAGVNLVNNTFALISSPKIASTYSASWLPKCKHWKFRTGYAVNISIPNITIKELRIFWHKDSDTISGQPSPPMQISLRLLLRPFFWRKFWSLPMTAKAFTPWWRVLQDCIGTKQKIHAWGQTAFMTPLCTICTMSCSFSYDSWL